MKEPIMMVPGKVYVRSSPTADGDDSYMDVKFVFEGVTTEGEFSFHLWKWTIDNVVFIPYSIVLPAKYSDGNWKEVNV